ncbi:MAG: DDE-type integrase/transposase/recombinase [Dolichospermum sp. WA123]|nr:DDE-type integrase/transposase/recombinase [Dolichospermum sp. WA123]
MFRRLNGNLPENEIVPARTIRHWKAKYLTALQKYGCGYIGLLSHRNAKGNRQRKLPEDTLAIMEKFILEDYETLKQKRMWEVYGALVLACEQSGVITPSYKAFTKEVKNRTGYEQTKKRQGRRAAYQQESFYWELTQTTPRHGDRPFEIGHIDHTQLDVELVCSRTGRNLGRPWATFLVDAYSRRLLAVYLTFDSPSYRSCLMVLRICVKRHGRLPQIVVVDNGTEFHGVYFETLLATFECTKKQRPPAKARFGSVCERLFGTSNTQFVYNLLGNTQITRNVRQVTKSVNPKNQAVWTLGLLYEYLCAWAYEVYDTDEHPAFFQSPRDAFAAGMTIGGSRIHRMIPYDENFHQSSLLNWYSRPGYCSECGEWLGINQCLKTFKNGEASIQVQFEWQSWTANVVGELISGTQSFESAPSKENITKSLNLLIDKVAENNAAAFSRLIGVPKNSLWMWQSTNTLPELNILLKICYKLEISLVEFLTPKNLITKSFTKISQKYLQLSRTPRVSPKAFDQYQVKDALLAILAGNEEPPPTMEEVAKRLGHHTRTISRHFPDLCSAISAKCRDYKKACHIKSMEKLCSEVREIVLNLNTQSVYPTEAAVSQLMTNPGYFRYKQVRAAFHDARRELGL